MTYKLKANQESFDVVDGPYAGKRYKTGQVYEEIPPKEKHRFESTERRAKSKSSRAAVLRKENDPRENSSPITNKE